jgi:DNA-binding IclR family transcriptional regulator
MVAWANGGATVVSVEPGMGSIFLGVRIGSILSLLRSASGRIFLAYMPRDITMTVLDRELADNPMTRASIEALIEQLEREGISRIRDSMMIGLSAVSAPVFDHEGRVAYALTSLGQSESFDTAIDSTMVQVVRKKAEELSSRLGFRTRMAG